MVQRVCGRRESKGGPRTWGLEKRGRFGMVRRGKDRRDTEDSGTRKGGRYRSRLR